MTPSQAKFLLDMVVLLVGVFSLVAARQSGFGGVFGRAMNFILLGLFVLTINHALDTLVLTDALTAAGHANASDFLQPALVHRLINLVGFLLIAFGFWTVARTAAKRK